MSSGFIILKSWPILLNVVVLINSELQQRWRALAIFSDIFDVQAAAAIWSVEIQLAKTTLSSLLKHGLLEWNPNTKTYRMHDLVRLFTDSRLSESERFLFQKRHALHYVAVLRKIEKLYEKGGNTIQQAINELELNWTNIHAGHSWAMLKAKEDSAAMELCYDYPEAGEELLEIRQLPQERMIWIKAGLVAAHKLEKRASECYLLTNLGTAYLNISKYSRAIKLFERALITARELGNREGEGMALGNLGRAYLHAGNPRLALEHFKQRLEIARELNLRKGEATGLLNSGSAHLALNEHDHALRCYNKSLDIIREIGDHSREASILTNIGSIYFELGDYNQALSYHQKALLLSRTIGDQRLEASVLSNQGGAYYALGNRNRAIQCMTQALNLHRIVGDRQGEGKALNNLGNFLIFQGKIFYSIELLEQSLKIKNEIRDRIGEGVTLLSLSHANFFVGNLQKVRDCFKEALEIARTTEGAEKLYFRIQTTNVFSYLFMMYFVFRVMNSASSIPLTENVRNIAAICGLAVGVLSVKSITAFKLCCAFILANICISFIPAEYERIETTIWFVGAIAGFMISRHFFSWFFRISSWLRLYYLIYLIRRLLRV